MGFLHSNWSYVPNSLCRDLHLCQQCTKRCTWSCKGVFYYHKLLSELPIKGETAPHKMTALQSRYNKDYCIVGMRRCIWSNISNIQAKKEELTSTTSLPKSSRLYPSKLYSILWISCIFMASSWDLLSSLMLWAQSVIHCSDVVMVSRPNVSSGKCFCKFYNHGDE